MKRAIFSISFLLFIIALCVVFFRISKARTFQFFGALTNRVDTSEKVVALTFDDAPMSAENVDKVLRILDEKGIKATFYVMGWSLEEDPISGKKIAEAGHEIGNHTFSHKRMVLKTPGFIKNEIEETDKLIRETGYEGEITFRPPNGKKLIALPWYLKQHNRKTIMWDLEPDTFPKVAASADKIAEYTADNVKPGSIILIHPFCNACSNDRAALGKIIDELTAKGYRFVTVSELLKHKQ